ncbi:hypothetical protein AQJ67_21300 [Streptomyces caeruleatus]|uniref:Uncharacterized protein n=1 Tax=Streptomyces caeruleatus TaxID=661399 RepID=A0A101U1J6_9ACTN|nr:hypothetical protein AQJ67_21300 [Streptomyces caeruleatus]
MIVLRGARVDRQDDRHGGACGDDSDGGDFPCTASPSTGLPRRDGRAGELAGWHDAVRVGACGQGTLLGHRFGAGQGDAGTVGCGCAGVAGRCGCTDLRTGLRRGLRDGGWRRAWARAGAGVGGGVRDVVGLGVFGFGSGVLGSYVFGGGRGLCRYGVVYVVRLTGVGWGGGRWGCGGLCRGGSGVAPVRWLGFGNLVVGWLGFGNLVVRWLEPVY